MFNDKEGGVYWDLLEIDFCLCSSPSVFAPPIESIPNSFLEILRQITNKMAAYCPSLSNQRDFLQDLYARDHRLDPGPEPPNPPGNMMFMNQASAASFPELSSGSSLPLYDPSDGARAEVEFIAPTSERTSVHLIDGEQNLRCQGLSLSLGTQISSGVHVPSFHYQCADPGSSSLSSHVQAEDGSQCKESRNDDYVSYNFPGGTYNAIKMGGLNSPYRSMGPNEMNSSPHLYEPSGLVGTILNSKYLKAAQQLLDEVVNVQEALKQFETNKHSDADEFGLNFSKELDMKMNVNSLDPHESTTNCSPELSQSERQDMKNKLSKLLSMLDEVDTRYRQYYHQMQILVSSFEMVAGRGAAKQYTLLALKTISRHFRSLRDAINSQVAVIRKNLGEEDTAQGGLPRLRYVDQKLRQQRAAAQQFGLMRHSWRPQRGLPESSVSILRAWLFEHFLHPYPKDSEKITLARKTGLTRSQVANWFINARVRLWKPMVEEMYKEEFGEELDFKSSPKHALEAATDMSWPSEEMREELQESTRTSTADGGQIGQFDGSSSGLFPDLGMQGFTARLGFQNSGCVENQYR